MPIYEYECRKCKAHIEVFQKLSDKPPVKCRKCGGRLEKLLSAPAIQFKGSGWYVTDYARKGQPPEKGETEAGASANAKEAGSDKKADKKTKESSPAKRTPEKATSPKASSGD